MAKAAKKRDLDYEFVLALNEVFERDFDTARSVDNPNTGWELTTRKTLCESEQVVGTIIVVPDDNTLDEYKLQLLSVPCSGSTLLELAEDALFLAWKHAALMEPEQRKLGSLVYLCFKEVQFDPASDSYETTVGLACLHDAIGKVLIR